MGSRDKILDQVFAASIKFKKTDSEVFELLTFTNENQSYVNDDANWFVAFFNQYLGLNK